MAAQNAEGIILRKYYLRETSFILVIYTKEFGKVKGIIKGVRNPYPQFAGNYEIFTECRFSIYRRSKKPFDLITGCEAIEPFIGARRDIERLTYANYFIELVDIVTDESGKNEVLYHILRESLKMLGEPSSPRRTTRIFELKLLDAIGLGPQLEECTVCGKISESENVFSARSGGIICRACSASARGDFLNVTNGTLNFMRKIRPTSISKTSLIKVSGEVGKEVEKILRRFIAYHINHPIKSLKFFEGLRTSGILK